MQQARINQVQNQQLDEPEIKFKPCSLSRSVPRFEVSLYCAHDGGHRGFGEDRWKGQSWRRAGGIERRGKSPRKGLERGAGKASQAHQ